MFASGGTGVWFKEAVLYPSKGGQGDQQQEAPGGMRVAIKKPTKGPRDYAAWHTQMLLEKKSNKSLLNWMNCLLGGAAVCPRAGQGGRGRNPQAMGEQKRWRNAHHSHNLYTFTNIGMKKVNLEININFLVKGLVTRWIFFECI